MDTSTLTWSELVTKKFSPEQLAKGVKIQILVVPRGRILENVEWGICDKDAVCIPQGVTVSIDEGEGDTFRLTGPKTAAQVLDAILRVGRGDPFDRKYTKKDAKYPSDCSGCPYQTFIGVVPRGKTPDGLQHYKALWSVHTCGFGVGALTGMGSFLDVESLTPERAANR